MSSVLDDFFACPSETLLESCTKKQLVKIAERFSIDLTTQDKRMKETLVTTLKRSLVDKGVFEVRAEVIVPSESVTFHPSELDSESERKFPDMSLQEKQLYLDAAKIRAEREDRAAKEREVEREFAARELDQQLAVRKLEIELERERDERAFQLKKLELELSVKRVEASRVDVPLGERHQPREPHEPVFDVHKNVKPRKFILLSHWNRVIRCRIFFLEGGVTTLCSLSFPAGGRISWKRVVDCTPLLPDYIA
nr:uncharacterized protein LOC129418227 isoform X2 [Misgurnus anguillicaudatus]